MSAEEQVKCTVTELGSKMLGVESKELADYGRALTGRTMPV
jgi:hypothetical protein